MNKKTKNKIAILVVIFTLCIFQSVYAAGSFSVSASSSSITVGSTTKVTVKVNNCAGRFDIKSSNTSVATISTSSAFLDKDSVVVTVNAKSAGTANILVTASDVADYDENPIVGNKSVTITVKAKATTPTTPTTPTTKSTNANLSVLRVNVDGLSPNFNKNTTTYSLGVGNNVNSLSLTVKTEDTKAKYYITGNSKFTAGDNIVRIVVTAENGAAKAYKIIVTKADDVEKANAYLSSVLINGVTLPNFDSKTLEYVLNDVSGDTEKLDIKGFAESKNATVNITGANELVDGENIIKITVTAEDKKTTRTYIFKLNKEKKDKEQEIMVYNEPADIVDSNNYISTENDGTLYMWKKIFKENGTVIFLYFLAFFEFIQVVYLYQKVKKLDPNYDRVTLGRKNKENIENTEEVEEIKKEEEKSSEDTEHRRRT